MVGLRVVDAETGEPIGYARGAAREAARVALFSLLLVPFVIDGLRPLWNERHQSWHDSLARSVVVLQPKRGAVETPPPKLDVAAATQATSPSGTRNPRLALALAGVAIALVLACWVAAIVAFAVSSHSLWQRVLAAQYLGIGWLVPGILLGVAWSLAGRRRAWAVGVLAVWLGLSLTGGLLEVTGERAGVYMGDDAPVTTRPAGDGPDPGAMVIRRVDLPIFELVYGSYVDNLRASATGAPKRSHDEWGRIGGYTAYYTTDYFAQSESATVERVLSQANTFTTPAGAKESLAYTCAHPPPKPDGDRGGGLTEIGQSRAAAPVVGSEAFEACAYETKYEWLGAWELWRTAVFWRTETATAALYVYHTAADASAIVAGLVRTQQAHMEEAIHEPVGDASVIERPAKATSYAAAMVIHPSDLAFRVDDSYIDDSYVSNGYTVHYSGVGSGITEVVQSDVRVFSTVAGARQSLANACATPPSQSDLTEGLVVKGRSRITAPPVGDEACAYVTAYRDMRGWSDVLPDGLPLYGVWISWRTGAITAAIHVVTDGDAMTHAVFLVNAQDARIQDETGRS
jgi:hypothetical protein